MLNAITPFYFVHEKVMANVNRELLFSFIDDLRITRKKLKNVENEKKEILIHSRESS
jgi:hypothetical protein